MGIINGYNISARNILKTFGSFFIKSEEIELDNITPADGQIIKRQSGKWVNVADPALNPYTTFTFNEGVLTPAGAIRTYKGSTLVETLNLDAYYVSATELTAILSGYAPISTLKETFKIHLNIGNGEDIATRLAGLIEGTDYPTGWTLSAGTDPKDLVVNHGLNRDVCDVKVFSLESGTSKRERIGSLAYVGLFTTDTDEFTIESVAQVSKELDIYVRFV